MSAVRKVFNLTNLTIVCVVAYLYLVGNNLYKLMNPLANVTLDPDEETVNPLWEKHQQFSLVCFLSHSSRFSPFTISSLANQNKLLLHLTNLTFHNDEDFDQIEISVDITDDNTTAEAYDSTVHVTNKQLWKAIRHNQSTVFLHALTVKHDEAGRTVDSITTETMNSGQGAYGVITLIKYDVIPKQFRHRYLLADLGFQNLSTAVETAQAALPSETIISYWKPEVAVRLVTDFTLYPLRQNGRYVGMLLILYTNVA